MAEVVPGERGDAIAGLDAEATERVGEFTGACKRLCVRTTMSRMVGSDGYDLATGMLRLSVTEDRADQERPIHHLSEHKVPLPSLHFGNPVRDTDSRKIPTNRIRPRTHLFAWCAEHSESPMQQRQHEKREEYCFADHQRDRPDADADQLFQFGLQANCADRDDQTPA